MKKWHFLLPLIPLAAVWAYVFAQSAGEFYDLMHAAPLASPAATADPATRDVVEAESAQEPARTVSPEPLEAVPVAEYSEPAYPYDEPYRNEDQYRYDEYQYSYDDEAAEGIPHPEVTDPAMRKLLAPAWAD